MEWDGFKIALGIVLMGILPILFLLLQRKRKLYEVLDIPGKIIYLLSLANLCGILVSMGNVEVAFSVLVGSSICHLLVVQGICFIQGKVQYVGIEKEQLIQKRKRSFSDIINNFSNNLESSSMFLTISFIVLLLLCADYLFYRGQGQNNLSRVDGGILILTGVAYFFLEGNKIGWQTIFSKVMKYIKEAPLKNIGAVLLLEVCILFGSYYLADGFLAVGIGHSILPYMIGFLFISWCVNIINIGVVSLSEEIHHNSCNQTSIFSITILLGICTICKEIYISTYEIYDLIILSLISIFFIFPIKIDSRLIGCCRMTVYFALIFYMLFR